MNGYHSHDVAEHDRANRGLELTANSLYNKVSKKGFLESLRRVFGREEVPPLFTLREVKRQIRDQGHEVVGEMTIDLDTVLGTASDGRIQDFDVDFRPLQTHNK